MVQPAGRSLSFWPAGDDSPEQWLPPELGAGPSCLAGAEMGTGEAWYVPWRLGQLSWEATHYLVLLTGGAYGVC